MPGTNGLCHRGVAVELFGERETGKTTAALVVGMSAAAAGERVLYLDRENGAALTHERLVGILEANEAWGDPLAAERFVGRHYPEFDRAWAPAEYAEAIAGLGFTGVMYDSVRELMIQLGLDNDRDFSRLCDLTVTPLIRRGLWVVLLDNTGHEQTHRPKGDGAKLDAIPQAYRAVASQPFSSVVTGRVSLTCTRSRYGDSGREWTMRVGGGAYDLPVARSEAPDAERARQLRDQRQKFSRACADALCERSPMGRDPLMTAIRERGVKGRNKRLQAWLKEDAADPATSIVSTPAGYTLTGRAPGQAPPGPGDAGQGGATPSGAPPGPLAPTLKGGPGPDRPGPHGAGCDGPVRAGAARPRDVIAPPTKSAQADGTCPRCPDTRRLVQTFRGEPYCVVCFWRGEAG